MEFGTKLRVMRVVRGLTQVELASLARISKPYVLLIESGKASPSEEYAAKLRSVLGWTPTTEEAFTILEGQDGTATACA